MWKIIYILAISCILCACNQVSVDDYQGTEPELDLEAFFSGNLKAYGILQDRSGMVTRKFTADLLANWDQGVGTIDEIFYFDDGEVQTREWTLSHLGDGIYEGTAGDVLGTAEGSVMGPVFQWSYQLEVPYRDGNISVTLDDWLFMVDEDSLINKTELTKFGFRVGELTLFIHKI